ncbi:FAD:protein FMN transferase [Aestuariivirga sp.]|uniref:FAD:protein FMN transferase n=1 Tax=Aestuariivirga sp. TaxID=2650926 RepID=UPI003BADA1F1
MSKMSTDLIRHALNGPTMGTRWSALFFSKPGIDVEPVRHALQAAVTEVDDQMSTWNPHSDLMRINRLPPGDWISAPARLVEVLRLGLAIGQASGGAFEVCMGDAVAAWGFGPQAPAGERIRHALAAPRRPGWEILDVEDGRLRKRGAVLLDLNGIAKGYGTDRLSAVLVTFGITSFLVGIDGEMRAAGLRPDGTPWSIAVEQPDHARRAVHSMLTLSDAAVATSGDYRHWINAGHARLSHTMDPARGAPVISGPASVTVVAASCAEADAWATALLVLGPECGSMVLQRNGLEALFLLRGTTGEITSRKTGRLFESGASAPAAPWSTGV